MKNIKTLENMNDVTLADEKYQCSHVDITKVELVDQENASESVIHLQNATPLEILSCILKFKNSDKVIILGGNAKLFSHIQFNVERNKGTQLGIFTSGTTGQPKIVLRSLSELLLKLGNKYSNRIEEESLIWGLLYNPEKMSGIQVLLSAYLRQESLYCPPTSADLTTKINYLVEAKVNALSATPSLWKFLIQNHSFRDLKLKQITLGGEAPDSEILRTLVNLYPTARISQIYASTELGVIFTVRDGEPGFPISYLTDTDRSPQLKISGGGELLVNFQGTWTNTGDNVKILGDRVSFIGRSDAIINIGGEKVDLKKVEDEILKLNNVVDVVVLPIPNRVLGNIIICDVVCQNTEEFNETDIKDKLRFSLRPVEIPAIIRLVPVIALNSNGKRTILK